MELPIINTRADLDSVAGTPRHTQFMAYLKGTMKRKQDIQSYPADYNKPEYTGPKLDPIWQEIDDHSTIERFGFSAADFA